MNYINIKCKNPRIILNPSLMNLLSVHRRYSLNGILVDVTSERLAHFKFSGMDYFRTMISYMNIDDIDKYGVIDKDTGELLPMFFLVPCGKCIACKYKKSIDWRVRCICESATSNCPPLFFTLTYDPLHLPKDGVNKRDVQLFLKRLRSRLNYLGYDVSHLRYFIVSEYGSNTGRAHYHGLFFNFPYMDRMIDKIDIIQDTWRNGFVMVSPARDNSGSYCMKYMYKEQKHKEGLQDTFFLSSRKNGGLGAQWLRDNFDFYSTHPAEVSIKVRCLDGSIKELPMPTYFSRKLFPSLSMLIPLDVRRSLDRLVMYKYMCFVVHDYLAKFHRKLDVFLPDDRIILDAFSPYGLIDDDYGLYNTFGYFSSLQSELRAHMSDYNYILTSYNYYYSLFSIELKFISDFLEKFDVTNLEKILCLGVEHKNFVKRFCENMSEVLYTDYEYKIQNIIAKDLQKEIF